MYCSLGVDVLANEVKDVQANTVVANNSMRVIRGIGPNAEDSHKGSIQAENETSIRIQTAERYPQHDRR